MFTCLSDVKGPAGTDTAVNAAPDILGGLFGGGGGGGAAGAGAAGGADLAAGGIISGAQSSIQGGLQLFQTLTQGKQEVKEAKKQLMMLQNDKSYQDDLAFLQRQIDDQRRKNDQLNQSLQSYWNIALVGSVLVVVGYAALKFVD
jgi:hypothetical protein